MTNQHENETNSNEANSNETRNMWIAVAVVVVLLLGGMGVNKLVHHDAVPETTQAGSSSQ
jgi:hypothetical protein